MKKILITMAALSMLTSCYYDNASEIYPSASLNQNCDTVDVNYTNNIAPLFSSNCGTNNSCHSASTANGGVILDSYTSASLIDTTLLLGSIEHSQGFKPMPPSGKMSDCGINQVKLWIRSGKPQ